MTNGARDSSRLRPSRCLPGPRLGDSCRKGCENLAAVVRRIGTNPGTKNPVRNRVSWLSYGTGGSTGRLGDKKWQWASQAVHICVLIRCKTREKPRKLGFFVDK
jgi:hypothetical protein